MPHHTLLLTSGQFAVAPVSWLEVQVHHGEYQDGVLFDRVQDCIRKRMGAACPHILIDSSPTFGRLQYPLNGGFDFDGEGCAQAGTTGFIERSGFVIFSARVRMKLVGHRPTKRRTSPTTCSPETGWTCPDRTSSRRRTASAVHSRWISSGAARCKLSTSRSASNALEAVESCIACSASCSTVGGIPIC